MPIHKVAGRFVKEMKRRKIDIATFGDSNAIFGSLDDSFSSGYNWGIVKRFSETIGIYASNTLNTGQSLPELYGVTGANTANGVIQDTAGTVLDAQSSYHLRMGLRNSSNVIADGNFTYQPGYLPDSVSSTVGSHLQSFTVSSPGSSALELFTSSDHLHWYHRYGTFDFGSGNFHPVAYAANSPFNKVKMGEIETNTGTAGIETGIWNIPQNSFTGTWRAQLHDISVKDADGPCSFGWNKVVHPGRIGVSVSRGIYWGGRSFIEITPEVQSWTQNSFNEWVEGLTMAQGVVKKDKMVIFWIMLEGNDILDTEDSLGPNPSPSNLPPGFLDNNIVLIEELQTKWKAGGYDPNNLLIITGPYHPMDPIRSTSVAGTTDTWNAHLARLESVFPTLEAMYPNVLTISGQEIMDGGEIIAIDGYDDEGDPPGTNLPASSAHMDQAGYTYFGQKAVDYLLSVTEEDGKGGTVSGIFQSPFVVGGRE